MQLYAYRNRHDMVGPSRPCQGYISEDIVTKTTAQYWGCLSLANINEADESIYVG
jgi:hypothetical protein